MLSPFVHEACRLSPAFCASIRLSSHASNAATSTMTSSSTSCFIWGAGMDWSSSSKGHLSDLIELPLPEKDSWQTRVCMEPSCRKLAKVEEGKPCWSSNVIGIDLSEDNKAIHYKEDTSSVYICL
jgi:hypothetical protein